MTGELVPPLFTGLVDDAGLFPPAELTMPVALARHRQDDAAGHPVLTGRFLCPAARLDELLERLTPGEQLPLGLISPMDTLPAALERIAGDSRVALAGVEGPLGDLAVLSAVPAGVPRFVEVPVTDPAAIRTVAAAGHAVKVRCGGLRADLFPTAEQLGAFVHTCAQAGAAFKATAGLHHALPYRDQHTGFAHHGFLTLLLAACRATDGAGVEEVAAALRASDAVAVAREARAVTAEHAAAARRLFTAYGSCSTSEPNDDLRALGLLTRTEVTA